MGLPIAIIAELALKVASKAMDRRQPTAAARPGAPAPVVLPSKTEVVAELAREIENNPVIKNELNQEAPYQSRVAVGAVVAALGVVAPPLLNLLGLNITGEQIVEFGGALITIGGAVYVLYGRFASGLKPLFAKK